jgi:hypothetical protein
MTMSGPTTNITIDKQVPGYWSAHLAGAERVTGERKAERKLSS